MGTTCHARRRVSGSAIKIENRKAAMLQIYCMYDAANELCIELGDKLSYH